MIILVTDVSENMILFTTPKMATDVESPILATAIISVGIPLATPYPFERSLKRHGTTTAGATAATIVPTTGNVAFKALQDLRQYDRRKFLVKKLYIIKIDA